MNLSELDTLIPRYAQNKLELDSYKKICEKENAEIKKIMKDYALPTHVVGDYKAVYTIQKRETINEEKLLEIAHQYGISDIIKTKEYIDFDALENAIYHGQISADVLAEIAKTKEVKEVVTLKVTKIKKAEEKIDD